VSNVFLCHRSPDKPLALKLARELEQAGHSVWYDDWEIQVGDSVIGKMDEGLTKADYFILCYSTSGDSKWTLLEWRSTLARQVTGGRVQLLPVFLSGGDMPAILADKATLDLVADWAGGVAALLKKMK